MYSHGDVVTVLDAPRGRIMCTGIISGKCFGGVELFDVQPDGCRSLEDRICRITADRLLTV